MPSADRLILCAILVTLCAAAPARAEDAFRMHHDRALELYQQQRYEASIDELKAAYAIRADARLFLNIGHAYRRLSRLEDALSYYRRYRDEARMLSEREREVAERYISQTERALAEARKEPERTAPEDAPPAPAPERRPLLPAVPAPAPVILAAPQAGPPPRTPLYRQWWIWGVIGIAVTGTVTAAVLASQPWDTGLPPDVLIHDPRF